MIFSPLFQRCLHIYSPTFKKKTIKERDILRKMHHHWSIWFVIASFIDFFNGFSNISNKATTICAHRLHIGQHYNHDVTSMLDKPGGVAHIPSSRTYVIGVCNVTEFCLYEPSVWGEKWVHEYYHDSNFKFYIMKYSRWPSCAGKRSVWN